MPILHMEMDLVRRVGNQLQQACRSLQQQTQQFNYSTQNLSNVWQGASANNFMDEMQPLLQQLGQLTDAGVILDQRLQREVDEWEQVASQFSAGPALSSWYAPLPTAAGGGSGEWLPDALANMQITLPPLAVVSWLQGWSEQWPDWLKERLSPYLTFLRPPLPSGPPPTPSPTGKTRLGELLEAAPTSEPKTVVPPPVSPAAKLAPPQPSAAGYPVPIKSQGSLGGSAACAPTSVSMILDYYHSLDPQNKTASPQQLLGMLDKGDFTFGQGMSLNRITDELQDLGYANVSVQVNASMADLQNQLQQGPVITTVRLDMSSGQLTATGSVIHAVVVKGLSGDGQAVFINDPWSGREVQMTSSDFNATWNGGENGLYVIRP